MTLTHISASNANVISGDINSLQEAHLFTWGNSNENIQSSWSLAALSPIDGVQSVWAYGSNRSWASNADIYIYSGPADITSITNAATFNYSSQPQEANIGDAIFFRGLNNFYGAWKINSFSIIKPDEDPMDWALFMTGKWYFQDNGTDNFSINSTSVPEPSSIMIFLLGFVFIRMRSLFR